jgi:hypothetical protein
MVEVSSINDIARLAGALERVPRPILALKDGERYKFMVHGDQVLDSSIFFYAISDSKAQYLAYELSSRGERVEFVEGVGEHGKVYLPIISISRAPKFFISRKGEGLSSLMEPIEVEDLPSLVKLSIYKLYYDEVAVPLFVSEEGDGWYIGSVVQIGETDGGAFYFYTRLGPKAPSGNFLRVDPSKITELDFKAGIGEHGYYYIKLIKLKDKVGIR